MESRRRQTTNHPENMPDNYTPKEAEAAEYTAEEMTRIEQQVYMDLTNAFFESNIMHYMDRDPYGMCAFLVCADTPAAREIVNDSPALYTFRGNSLIVTVNHPDR